MSWLSSGLKKLRKSVGLPPLTLGNVLKAGAVVGGTAIGGPAVGGALAGVLKGGKAALQALGNQVKDSLAVTVDPVTDRVTVSAGATLPSGTVASNMPVSALPGMPGGNGPSWMRLPWYYYAAAAVVLYLVVRGVTK